MRTENRPPLEHQVNDSNQSEDNCVEGLTAISYLSSLFPNTISILAYIGGYIIQMLSESLSCETYYNAMISPTGIVSREHYLNFVKGNGGLLYPSEGVLKILKTCEVVLKTVVSGTDFQKSKLKLKYSYKFITSKII